MVLSIGVAEVVRRWGFLALGQARVGAPEVYTHCMGGLALKAAPGYLADPLLLPVLTALAVVVRFLVVYPL